MCADLLMTAGKSFSINGDRTEKLIDRIFNSPFPSSRDFSQLWPIIEQSAESEKEEKFLFFIMGFLIGIARPDFEREEEVGGYA